MNLKLIYRLTVFLSFIIGSSTFAQEWDFELFAEFYDQSLENGIDLGYEAETRGGELIITYDSGLEVKFDIHEVPHSRDDGTFYYTYYFTYNDTDTSEVEEDNFYDEVSLPEDEYEYLDEDILDQLKEHEIIPKDTSEDGGDDTSEEDTTSEQEIDEVEPVILENKSEVILRYSELKSLKDPLFRRLSVPDPNNDVNLHLDRFNQIKDKLNVQPPSAFCTVMSSHVIINLMQEKKIVPEGKVFEFFNEKYSKELYQYYNFETNEYSEKRKEGFVKGKGLNIINYYEMLKSVGDNYNLNIDVERIIDFKEPPSAKDKQKVLDLLNNKGLVAATVSGGPGYKHAVVVMGYKYDVDRNLFLIYKDPTNPDLLETNFKSIEWNNSIIINKKNEK